MNPERAFSLEFSLDAGDDPIGETNETILRDLSAYVLAAEKATGDWEIAVALLRDDALQRLHHQFMAIDEPTDIMTFPYGGGAMGGDLAISVDHALARATEWSHSPSEEIEYLVAHGLLHLLGWNDVTDQQRASMLERQAALIAAWRHERAAD